MSIYFDASFLVSLYSSDVNSPATLPAMQLVTGDLWITTFAEFEFVNALSLRVFRKHDSPSQSKISLAAFEQDMRARTFLLKPLPERVFMRARELSLLTTSSMGTRAGDLLHVAAALELGADGFYTFDHQQAKLAQTVKLKVNALP